MASSLTYAVIFIAIVEFTLSILGISSTNTTTLLTLLSNPTSWNNISIIQLFGLSLTGASAVTAVAYFFYKTDTMLRAPIALALLSFGSSLITLFALINANSNIVVASFLVGIPLMIYVTTVINWWFGRD